MKFEGRLLLFDVIDYINTKFSKDCKFIFPEKVPFTWNFNLTNDPNLILGYAHITKDDSGLLVDGELTNKLIIELIHNDILYLDEIGIGGRYDKLKTHMEDSIRVVDECTISCIAFVTKPVNDIYKIEPVEY